MTTRPPTIDANAPDRIGLTQLARELDMVPSTTHRWATSGCEGVRLPVICIGRKRFTTREAFGWWTEEVTRRRDGDRAGSTPAHSPAEERHQDQVEAELERLGC